MRRIRTYHEIDDPAGAEVLGQVVAQRRRLADRLARIRRVVVVGSGKGGVGKSAVAANLAAELARRGRRVGAADADLNGPSLARMLGADPEPLRVGEDGVQPATGAGGVRAISMDLLLDGADAPLRWRGPEGDEHVWQSTIETSALREFLADTAWGELDYLLLDVPPGTDKLARVLDLLPRIDLLLLISTPSEMARYIVAKSATLVREAAAARRGLVLNMCAHRCPHCGGEVPLFEGDGEAAAPGAPDFPAWAEIPFDPALARATDTGTPAVLVDPPGPAALALRELADRVEHELADTPAPAPSPAPSR